MFLDIFVSKEGPHYNPLNGIRKYPVMLSILSGFLLGISVVSLNAWLIWIALVPLIFGIEGRPVRSVAKYAMLFGISFGIVSLAWMPGALQTYGGISWVYGIAGMIAVVLVLSVWYVAAYGLYAFLRKNTDKRKRYIWLNLILFVAVIQSIDFIRFQILPGFPWDKYVFSLALAKNVYMIQLASVVGLSGLSILISAINFLLAQAILHRTWRYIYIALIVFVANMLYGGIIYHKTVTKGPEGRLIGIVCENVEAETRWTDTGDNIIRSMLGLVEEAAKRKPDLLVWSETALPWTFVEDDDILQALAGIMIRNHTVTEHIIGYLSKAKDNPDLVYNSAYLIDATGQAIARVDKYQLLTFFEEPLLRSSKRLFIPMLTQSVYDNIKRGDRNKLLSTNIGAAWVMICNESLLPNWCNRSIRNAHFLVNISNDAWLENTQNIAQHFYIARLKAVEYRKYLVINSNRGVSGIVNNRGEVVVRSQSQDPELLMGTIYPNYRATFYARFPNLQSYICLCLTLIIIMSTFVDMFNQSTPKPE